MLVYKDFKYSIVEYKSIIFLCDYHQSSASESLCGRDWQSVSGCIKQSLDHIFQVKTAIKTITEFSKISRKMFLVDGEVSTQDGIFHVSGVKHKSEGPLSEPSLFLSKMVELRGIEPLTYALRTRRSPS